MNKDVSYVNFLTCSGRETEGKKREREKEQLEIQKNPHNLYMSSVHTSNSLTYES